MSDAPRHPDMPHPDSHLHPVAAPCGRRFAEELLSGFLDGALTQGDGQRVQVHLEDCAECRAHLREMSELREVTMSTRFAMPADDQWDERPRGPVSLWSRRLGWLLVVAWLVGIAAFVLWEIAVGPQSLLEKTLVFGGLTGALLLFVSILADRLRTLPGDRYRGVSR